MKAFIRRLICLISLLVFIASFIVFFKTDRLDPYLFILLSLGSMIVFLYCVADIYFEEDDEK